MRTDALPCHSAALDAVRMLSESVGWRNPHGVVMVGAIGDQPVVVVGEVARNRWFEDHEAHRDPSASMGCWWLVAPHDERPRAPTPAHFAPPVPLSGRCGQRRRCRRARTHNRSLRRSGPCGWNGRTPSWSHRGHWSAKEGIVKETQYDRQAYGSRRHQRREP